MRHIFFILLTLNVISCTSSVNDTNGSDPLFGIWQIENQKTIENTGTEYNCIKASDLNDNLSIIFEEPNIFKSWDFGWCGTPPHHYFLTEGKFSRQENTLFLDINHYFYKGRKIEILELNDNHLRFILEE
ncbi:MAG: hypothetical protein R2774_02055 [Saprospiraceae bacterium]